MNKLGGMALLVGAAAVIGCLAGGIPWISRAGSLSRSLVFLPYFMAGMFCPSDIKWGKARGAGLIFLTLGLLLCWKSRGVISATFLYQASAYGNIVSGAGRRLMCYLVGGCLGVFLLAWMPEKRFCCTKAGADTMMMYVLHGPVVEVLWNFDFLSPWYELLAPVAAAGILGMCYKIFQWNGRLFMIRGNDNGSI